MSVSPTSDTEYAFRVLTLPATTRLDNGTLIRVLYTLLWYGHNSIAPPSFDIESIAADSGVTEQQAIASLRYLEDAGFIGLVVVT